MGKPLNPGKPAFQLAPPNLQIGFANRLLALKKTHLQQALLETVSRLDIVALDAEVAQLAASDGLRTLAKFGLRAETAFVLPTVLKTRPTLLTYYRTLLGYSQKEFYKSGTGLGTFKSAEETGILSAAAASHLTEFCKFLNLQISILLAGLEGIDLSTGFLNELSLLSVGPQLRGGNNNLLGQAGIAEVFSLIKEAVSHSRHEIETTRITLINAAGRTVLIEVAADPDIVISEQSPSQNDRPLVVIEVKAGKDKSNIHNRIGEAEKSHLKAKARGFTQFWTITNVDQIPLEIASRQSPTTDQFFSLSELMDLTSATRGEFMTRVIELTGLPAKKMTPVKRRQS